MPKSSVHRLLQSLQELGFVHKLEIGRYTLSADIFDFIHEIAWNFGRNLRLDDQLRAAALRLNCSIYISMLGRRDTYVICAAGDEGNTARLGIHARAYTSSAGKVLIAQKSPKSWPDFAPRSDEEPATPYTNRSPRKFLTELKKVRKTALAWNHRESSADHVSLATIVREPFITVPRLSVALVLRQEQFENRDAVQLEADLRALALELERELGSR